MKKVLSITLLTFVLLAGSRIAVNLHYCGGKLASVEFFPKQKETCGKCGMKKSKTCCQDVSQVFSSEDHSVTSFSFDFNQQLVALPAIGFTFQWESPVILSVNKTTLWANAPPSFRKTPKYLLFRSIIV